MSTALAVVAAYLIGSVPFGLLVGKLSGGVDVRSRGSGNIGATNVARSLGMGLGILTLALDLGKGSAGVWLGQRATEDGWAPALAGLAAILGHVFPAYLRFRGGKGVATGCGAFLVLSPGATLVAAGVFLVIVTATRRVSLGSIGASIALPLILALGGAVAPVLIASLVSTALILVRHRENIQKILAGTEPRLGEGR